MARNDKLKGITFWFVFLVRMMEEEQSQGD